MCLLSQLFAVSPISIHFLTTPMSHMSTHTAPEEETTLRRRIAAPRRIILGMAHGIGFTTLWASMGPKYKVFRHLKANL